MLFPKERWEGLADGSVTVAFRRWRRPTVRTGGTLRSPVGRLAIDEVAVVDRDAVTDADARATGAVDRAEVLEALDARPDGEIHRIRFHRLDEPDPRDLLAADDDLSDDDLVDLRRRLDRKDQRGERAPWTRRVLRLVGERPEVAAGELADELGWDRLDLKRDVRKLKVLGLTVSHRVGYSLSPRGRAFLAAEADGDASTTGRRGADH
ncbi:hypothetical protein [Salsipaludibacter albus]|uniref:hypothetical protein n=1 Tax=Salsipaludibacter albus TaxID=2849650 RepID=UPI001EE3CCFC|nr:hypothetical protein [Salsipaludibacter albus]MBY5161766.1 hypothetical protein [Salsipaludibacter albus]